MYGGGGNHKHQVLRKLFKVIAGMWGGEEKKGSLQIAIAIQH